MLRDAPVLDDEVSAVRDREPPVRKNPPKVKAKAKGKTKAAPAPKKRSKKDKEPEPHEDDEEEEEDPEESDEDDMRSSKRGTAGPISIGGRRVVTSFYNQRDLNRMPASWTHWGIRSVMNSSR